MTKKSIAVIPARGGSKRIKNKNIREFAGKPLITYSIAAALKSESFDEIVVSTDSQDIAEIALAYGASNIIMRPEELANDHVGTTPVVIHSIKQMERDLGELDYVCCIYATAPFLSEELLRKGLEALKANPQKKYAFSVTTFDFPIQRALRMEKNGVEPLDRSMMIKRSQDLEECYHDAGQFYWGTKKAWIEGAGVFCPHSLPVILPRYLVQDIDTEEDWVRAELMYKAYVAS
ncbi:pseudaminic acid cytidylyltransferase [Alteromonas sediminis]|uniref:pseudaminic acid cytidylyltransferase n=1 Tax=Alteromonas sediminis TaxID=2259342 RepID=UPI001F0BB76F|nr:pseudaminic acid cytidylyltransferase [Alteromonas sediminis]